MHCPRKGADGIPVTPHVQMFQLPAYQQMAHGDSPANGTSASIARVMSGS